MLRLEWAAPIRQRICAVALVTGDRAVTKTLERKQREAVRVMRWNRWNFPAAVYRTAVGMIGYIVLTGRLPVCKHIIALSSGEATCTLQLKVFTDSTANVGMPAVLGQGVCDT